MAEVKAQLNNLRIAPRKVRAVVNLVKGKNVNDALNQLEYYVRKPADPIRKLINSAVANAENNFNMVKDNLFIKSFMVDEGIKLRRFRAKGFGRAAMIQKKTSHLRLILDERTPGIRKEKQAVKAKKVSEPTKEDAKTSEAKKPASGDARQGRPEVKREIGKKGVLGIGKKLFQRKAV